MTVKWSIMDPRAVKRHVDRISQALEKSSVNFND